MYTHIHTHIYYIYTGCAGSSLVVASRGYTLDVIHGLLTIVASFVAEHRF